MAGMRGALKEELTNRFPWLFDDLGFHLARHDFSYKAMGSSFAVIESDVLRVRFENHRGFLDVEVAALAEPERWMNLSALWLYLTGERPTPELDGWAWFLRDHLDRITEALGPNHDATKIAFDQFLTQAAAAVARSASGSAANSVRRAARAARIREFFGGPLGWIVAAVLLIWLAVR
jgi:hypothetical protein